MKEITLTNGMKTQIDDDIFDQYGHLSFYAVKRKKNYYATTETKGKKIRLHNLVLGYPLPGFQPDHRDGHSLNNQRDNLRWSTQTEQQRNRGPKESSHGTPSKSQYKGVSPIMLNKPGRSRPWRARIKIPEKHSQISIGYFATEIEAAQAYDAAARQYFGDFARLNFP